MFLSQPPITRLGDLAVVSYPAVGGEFSDAELQRAERGSPPAPGERSMRSGLVQSAASR